jgi:hypothetical protein
MLPQLMPTCAIIDSSLREGEGVEAIQVRDVKFWIASLRSQMTGQSFCNVVRTTVSQNA